MTALLIVGTLGLLLVVAGLFIGEHLDGSVYALFPLDLGPGISAALGAGLAAFGFGGALALRSSDLSLAVALSAGGLGGLAVAGAALVTTRLLLGGESAPPRSSDLYGVFGTVISGIPAGGLGEVALVHNGARVKRAARADNALPSGTSVYVLEVLSETAVLVAPSTPVLPTISEESP